MYEPLMEFIKKESADTDIFCFQEVFRGAKDIVSNGMRMDTFENLVELLPDFDAYFTAIFERHDFSKTVNFAVTEGTAIFVKKSIPIIIHGSQFIYGVYNDIVVHDKAIDIPVAAHYIHFENNNQSYFLTHLHGLPFPPDKLDCPGRLEQSRNIINFLNQQTGSKILCGDFNLLPDTESIKMIEKSGMRNLIGEFNIKTTRSASNFKKYPDSPQYFADYMFVSPELNIKKFSVPQLEISDHLPMILEF